jgi:hypothetical protein
VENNRITKLIDERSEKYYLKAAKEVINYIN